MVPKVIGITGGIASGKSNVSNVIESLGYTVLDCDKITALLSLENMPIYNAIKKEFGEDYFLDDLSLDKKKIAKLIFNNKFEKERLDNITHPIIKKYLKDEINKFDGKLLFIEIPLLYEAKFEDLCDKIICVFLSKKMQVIRLMEREGIDEDYALLKIHSQMDLYMKKSLADYVIDSKGDFSETKSQVIDLIKKIEGEI